MKKMRQRILLPVIPAMAVSAAMPVTAFAADAVARIGTATYDTLDAAIAAAKDGETIEVLRDAETAGLNLSKDLTIKGVSETGKKPTVNFTNKGIALWGIDLTFTNCDVVMDGITSTPYGEWSWMAICASKDATLTLNNASMTLDADPDGSTRSGGHVIYFCSNNKLNLINSTLAIYDYAQDALEWDGGDGGYNVNITDSTFISDNNRSGFTGTFYATIKNSDVDVINSSGNGSNGSHFIIEDSNVNFSDNGSHGLSAGYLIVDSSIVTAENNKGMGIAVGNDMELSNGSEVTVTGNASNGSYGYAAVRLYNDNSFTVDNTSALYIKDNHNTGLYVRQGNLNVAEGSILEITGNKVTHDLLDGYGGGLYVGYGDNYDPTVVLPHDAVIYNNHATAGGDDIYVSEGVEGPSLTFGPVGAGWSLDGDPDCEHLIDGWYDDTEETRWEAHADNAEDNHIVRFDVDDEITVNESIQLKAAHGEEALDKTSYPALEKKVLTTDEDGAEVWGDAGTAAAGGEVQFRLESNVPQDLLNYIEAKEPEDPVATPATLTLFAAKVRGEYTLTFHDEMEDVFVDPSNFEVVIEREDGKVTLDEDQYTLITEPNDDCDFEISIDLVALYEAGIITEDDLEGTPIVVSYTAVLDKTTVAGRYYNTAWVTYPEGESNKDKVAVDTFKIEIFKYDQADPTKGLAGAKFELYQKDSSGEVITDSVIERVSDTEGRIVIDGLDAGIYYLKETEAPENYICSDEELTITIPDQAGVSNAVSVKFANSNVPHTGGSGTGMFTVGGIVIIAAAGVMLVISRRKKYDK